MMRPPAFKLLPVPSPLPLAGKRVLVLGLGDTGLSVARWLALQGAHARVADTRAEPPHARTFSGELHSGPFSEALLDAIDAVCVSPGLSLEQKIIDEALARGIPVLGDVELFAWQNHAPVIAVTGTNGKSTVTALAGHLLQTAGVDAEVAGNIAPPVLEAQMQRKAPPAAWVLELSSYQLETTWSLNPRAAAMLNVSEDHLDRYGSLETYAAAKARIFAGDGIQVLNRDDSFSRAMALPGREVLTFGLGAPPSAIDFGIEGDFLVEGVERIVETRALPLHGAHNVANALAACALARAYGLPRETLAAGLRSFRGLPHRLELVATRHGVHWYDDSKGTNVGATLAALRGLGRPAIVILGGEGKGQDFTPLREALRRHARGALLIGRDAERIARALEGLPIEPCATLEAAVTRADRLAHPGDAVLLSPACASFDMFRDYRHRGEVFAAAVRALPAAKGAPH